LAAEEHLTERFLETGGHGEIQFSPNFFFTLTSWFVALRVGAEKVSLVPGTRVELVVIVNGGLAGEKY